MGRGVSALGQALFEIKQREDRADDILASDNVSFSTQNAKDKFAAFKESSPDPKTWSDGSKTIWDEAFTSVSGQRFNDKDIGERVLFNFQAERQHANNVAGIQAVDASAKIAVKATRDTFIKALERGDDVKQEALLHQEALKNVLGDDDLVRIAMEEVIATGTKKRYINQSKLMPETTIEEMQTLRDAIGKTGVDETGLDAKDYSDIIRSAQTEIQAQNRDLNNQYRETERELHKKFIAGTLTKEENDRAFNAGESNTATHKAYDTIIKNKELTETDAVLAEKWLNGTLTKADITEAQKEGRLNNSAVVGAWLSRLNQGQFNAGAYDRALTKIREVRFDKGKYNEVRLYLLKNAEDLGGKWDDVRNRLETAMNAKDDAIGPHVRRAHGLIDGYAQANPEINDGTLESIQRIQQLHDSVDARADQTPEQIRNLTQALLLPYEEEKAKGWFSGAFENITKYSPLGITIRGSKKVRAKKQKIFRSLMLIQPVSKNEFKTKVTSLKSIFGDDSKESKQFYDRYVDSYNWETE